MSDLQNTLLRLGHVAHNGDYAGGPEWDAARLALANGDIIPPAEMLAPAFLENVGPTTLNECANACVAYVLHTKRHMAAEDALAKLASYTPRTVAEMLRAGWSESAAFQAINAAEAARRRGLAQRRKARFEGKV